MKLTLGDVALAGLLVALLVWALWAALTGAPSYGGFR